MGNKLPIIDKNTLILGPKSSGKSTLLTNIIVKNKDTTYYETLGFNVEILKIYEKNVSFWELGGKSKVKKWWKKYYNLIKFDIFIWILGPLNFQEIDEKKKFQSLNFLNYITNEFSLKDVPLIIIINEENEKNEKCLYFKDEETYKKKIKKLKKYFNFDNLIQNKKELIMFDLRIKENYLIFYNSFINFLNLDNKKELKTDIKNKKGEIDKIVN